MSQDTERFLDTHERGKKKRNTRRETQAETARQAGRRQIGNKLNYRQTAGLNS